MARNRKDIETNLQNFRNYHPPQGIPKKRSQGNPGSKGNTKPRTPLQLANMAYGSECLKLYGPLGMLRKALEQYNFPPSYIQLVDQLKSEVQKQLKLRHTFRLEKLKEGDLTRKRNPV